MFHFVRLYAITMLFFLFSSRRRHTRCYRDWSSDVCSSDLDLRDTVKPGAKYFEWEAKGVPLRLEIGPRDVQAGQVMAARRTGGKAPLRLDAVVALAAQALDELQAALFTAARERR